MAVLKMQRLGLCALKKNRKELLELLQAPGRSGYRYRCRGGRGVPEDGYLKGAGGL